MLEYLRREISFQAIKENLKRRSTGKAKVFNLSDNLVLVVVYL